MRSLVGDAAAGGRAFPRRAFLRTGAGAACALALPGCPEVPATPLPFGRPPDADANAALLTADERPDGVLEIFLPGGLNAFDSFYVTPQDPGAPYWLLHGGPGGVPAAMAPCLLAGEDLTLPFARDSAGVDVALGPFLLPLRRRADLLARLRVLVTRHDDAPHQTAIPLALCGHRLGSPRMAGTAAHAQRYFGEAAPRPLPYAFVLVPRLQDLSDFNGDVGAAVGRHPGTARPLTLHLAAFARLQERLARGGLPTDPATFDAAVDVYRRAFADRLRADGRALRARLRDDYDHARGAIAQAAAVAAALPAVDDALDGAVCGATIGPDQTAQGLDAAVALLTNPDAPARWVTHIDGGIGATSVATAYDTHDDHVRIAARNVTHLFEALATRINEPGERDPRKLDLDRHLVVLTTEFGRSPFVEGDDGLDHWPDGYAVAVLGGPVRAEHAGVVGAIGGDGVATDALHPAQLRAALLLAQGIWPFHPDGFDVGDVLSGADPIEAARVLRARVWGRS